MAYLRGPNGSQITSQRNFGNLPKKIVIITVKDEKHLKQSMQPAETQLKRVLKEQYNRENNHFVLYSIITRVELVHSSFIYISILFGPNCRPFWFMQQLENPNWMQLTAKWCNNFLLWIKFNYITWSIFFVFLYLLPVNYESCPNTSKPLKNKTLLYFQQW